MTDDPQAEVIKETVDAKAEPELAPETVEVVETEKADATPLLLEIKGQLEKLENQYGQLLIALAPPTEAKALDYPKDQVDALVARFDEPKAVRLIETIGEDAFLLIGKAEETVAEKTVSKEPSSPDPIEAPEVKAVPAPEVVAVPADDIKSEVEKQVAEKLAKIEAAYNDQATVQKRTPAVPTSTETEQDVDLRKMATISWDEAAEIASRGATT